MTIISFPKTTVNKLPAQLPAGVDAQKILVVGQKLATGSATAGSLITDVKKTDVDTKFGAGSICAGMLNPIFKIFEDSQGDVAPRVDVISLDDAGTAVQATSDIVISEKGGVTDAATVAGTLTFKIAGSEYSLAIAVGDTISTIGAALNTVLTDTDAPFSTAEVTNTITMTFRNGGSVGNNTPVAVSGVEYDGTDYVLGNVKIVINAFTSGATNPTMTTVLDVVGNERYQTIVAPVEYGTDYILDDFLDTRFNVTNDILDGVAILTDVDTLANLKTTLGALNSQSCIYVCDVLYTDGDNKGGSLKKMPYEVSAQVAAVRGLRLTEDANILNITPASTYGALDGEGGFEIRSLPYANTPLNDIDVIDTGLGFSKVEISEINTAGGTVIGNNTAKNGILLGEVFTTYKTDAAGNEDVTWRFLNTVDEMSGSAEYIFNNLKKRFVQSRLTSGTLKAGRSMANESSIKAYMKELYKDLGELVVVPTGKTAEDYFYDNMTLTIDFVDGKVSIIANFPIVVQLRELLVNLITQFGN